MCLASPGKIIEIAGEEISRTAKVDFDGAVKSDISLFLCPLAKVEDYCFVRSGYVLEVIDEEYAHKVLSLFC